jgi:hypothetical protein
MWPALPASDYYEDSAPTCGHQQTACLAAARLADGQEGDHRSVPTFTMNRLTGSVPSFSPAGLSTATPQPFTVALGTTTGAEAVTPGCRGRQRTAIPALIHQVRASPTS